MGNGQNYVCGCMGLWSCCCAIMFIDIFGPSLLGPWSVSLDPENEFEKLNGVCTITSVSHTTERDLRDDGRVFCWDIYETAFITEDDRYGGDYQLPQEMTQRNAFDESSEMFDQPCNARYACDEIVCESHIFHSEQPFCHDSASQDARWSFDARCTDTIDGCYDPSTGKHLSLIHI